MPIAKGSAAAHERALKAAETRRRNRAAGVTKQAPAFPASYHATPTRHVTRDLRMKQTIKKPKLRKPLTKRQVRTATEAQLRDEMDYWGNIPGSQIKTRAQDDAYYTAKNELTLRANPNLALYMHRQGARAIGGKTVRKRQARTVRATAPRTRPRKRRSHRSRYK